MGKGRDRTVHQQPDGRWSNQRQNAGRASSVRDTQQQAIADARRMLQNSGGGELTVMGTNGKIRSKDTIKPGHDPCPPKDREH